MARRWGPGKPGELRLRALLSAFAVASAFASLGATCVDGVTPDCAGDAGCGPSNIDGSADADASITLPEAGNDAGADTSQPDAPADAPDDVEEAADDI